MTHHHDVYPVYVGKHTGKFIIEYHVPDIMDWLDDVNVVVPEQIEQYVESIELKVNNFVPSEFEHYVGRNNMRKIYATAEGGGHIDTVRFAVIFYWRIIHM